MNSALLDNQFVQVALPIMFTVLLAAWINSRGMDKAIEGVNRRLDDLRADMNDRSGEVNRRLDRIDENAQCAERQDLSARRAHVSSLAARVKRWKICVFCSRRVRLNSATKVRSTVNLRVELSPKRFQRCSSCRSLILVGRFIRRRRTVTRPLAVKPAISPLRNS